MERNVDLQMSLIVLTKMCKKRLQLPNTISAQP